jgi:2-C-methyl-D-erythritol 4-phosphate cytidylyltransferase
MSKRIGVIIPAAGTGKRLGGVFKPFIEAGGKPIILRLLDLFAALPDISALCVAVPPGRIPDFKHIVNSSAGLSTLVEIVEGGTERPLSVRNAYERLSVSLSDDDLICIHDAARPLLSEEDLNRVIEAGWEYGAAFLAAKIKDTLKLVDENGFCTTTIDRSAVFAAQTPQVMKLGLLKKAYNGVIDYSLVTDEIMLMEKIGVKAFVVEPRHLNFKITTSEDLDLLRKFTS